MAVKRVGLLGAGTMGGDIAQTVAATGIEVYIVEVSEQAVQEAIKAIEQNIDAEIAKWGMTESEKRAILSRIIPSTDIEDLKKKRVEVIIEAVPEDLQSKKEVFSQIDAICDKDTLLISNTATLSITEIAADLVHKDKLIGMHFLNPAPKVPLVEIVRGLATSDETCAQAREFAEEIGKTPVEVFEYPGYITARVIVPLLNEAMYVLMEGIASAEDIDTAMRLGFNLGIGPLTLIDQIGLDELLRWMESIHDELGELKYRPCPLLRKLVRAGYLGKKVGRGIFQYDEAGNKIGSSFGSISNPLEVKRKIY
ncbi:3-hydroxybutyryl-CoA dehydrogenase [candidate division KSB1 bacterium]|nr:3-hydroxybutyryl-CoA dehydrogenase [bacterium]RKY78256.1 MAG: 3-hydroxybutyryl-CoA dehydrogenase [candidate division KSB1 bacterium]RKY84903.1 MAG: 3-hydroxybutyryl-CoA dehydrogenase [candidate division KSB1 bacterium]RKY87387.1 MAG: 3-hydroxybutyryl-CoA dehydrogenase [candidate division KSB1 bacterium]RKY90559.1 MAG: 3-hydroxybutyryl-CoA dehydrogenase [candidate division KSB1 bacterium]